MHTHTKNAYFLIVLCFHQVIYQCTANDGNWVCHSDILTFLPSEEDDQVRFIIGSEETGHRHLYLVTAACIPDEDEGDMDILNETEGMLRPRIHRCQCQ